MKTYTHICIYIHIYNMYIYILNIYTYIYWIYIYIYIYIHIYIYTYIQVFTFNKVLMHFKILFVFAFILHIYLHFCKATNLYHLFSIVFYWTKATFIVYLKNYLYIYASIYTSTAYEQMLSQNCWFFVKALLCAIIFLQVTSSVMGNRLFFSALFLNIFA